MHVKRIYDAKKEGDNEIISSVHVQIDTTHKVMLTTKLAKTKQSSKP